MDYLFFDNASTTRCLVEAAELMARFADQCFGNPSSTHALGQQSARAIREARLFFAQAFNTGPEQIIFTGSGSEADNLAIYGVALDALTASPNRKPRVLASAIEHPAVRKTAQSLAALGFDVRLIPVTSEGQINREKLLELLTPDTLLVSIQQVNNIVGSVLPVEELAGLAKQRVPELIFHVDAVQSFGKLKAPGSPGPVDMVSISSHKIHGPKGVGALIVLNKKLLSTGLRPLIWGGEQEGGFRSGTQNAGLIAGFHFAAKHALESLESTITHVTRLRARLWELLEAKRLLAGDHGPIRWNSPLSAVPHIVSLSVPGYPSGPLAKLLEERGCLVSTGSACSSQKIEPDAVLAALGLPSANQVSAIRISFSNDNRIEDVDRLASAIDESIQLMKKLLGGGSKGKGPR